MSWARGAEAGPCRSAADAGDRRPDAAASGVRAGVQVVATRRIEVRDVGGVADEDQPRRELQRTSDVIARDLLHLAGQGALGTLLADAQGQPFVSAIECVPDQGNAPVFLISRLAEHTKNLERDPRASLLLAAPAQAGGVLAQARMTLVGEARRFDAEPGLVARYLRYFPAAEAYLALGYFAVDRFVLAPTREAALIADLSVIHI